MLFRTLSTHDEADCISSFLKKHYQPGNKDGNWIYPIWEYSYTHPGFDPPILDDIGIWEEDGEIVAATLVETERNDISLAVAPEYEALKPDMLEYAESVFFAAGGDGGQSLNVFVHEDDEFNKAIGDFGYTHEGKLDRPMSVICIPPEFVSPELPQGFVYQGLSDDPDRTKMHRCLHRGFNHKGEPDPADLPGRVVMTSGPGFIPELTTAVAAPDGSWVSYCGMWFDKANRFGYVEPVATDPDFRRMGLGRAAVLESVRKCGERGADRAFVWTDLQFYLAIGFSVVYRYTCWTKRR